MQPVLIVPSDPDGEESTFEPTGQFRDIRFSHAFQPIVDLERRATLSYEVLVRGDKNESAGSVFGRVRDSDLLAFDQASRERALLLARRLGVDTLLNLNFSPGSIMKDDGRLLDATLGWADLNGVGIEQLVIEVTEGEAVRDHRRLAVVLDRFRAEGVSIAIDDFGAGYAGLNLLAEIQPEYLKLDMALVRDIHEHGPRQAIVNAIREVSLDLGIDLIAEGIETRDELRFLQDKGIELFQGYLLAKPGFETLPEVTFPLGSDFPPADDA